MLAIWQPSKYHAILHFSNIYSCAFIVGPHSFAKPWIDLQLATAALLPPLEAEAGVLGVISVTNVAYGKYAHTILAQKAGFTLAQVQSMLAGVPTDIPPLPLAAYEVAVKLAQTRGPLDSASWNEAFSVLGQLGTHGAIMQAAAFMHASMMMNGGDVCLPENVAC